MSNITKMDPSWIKRWSLTGLPAYVLAVVLAGGGGALRMALTPYMGDSTPYGLFVPAMVIVPFLSGLAPALLALVITLLMGWFGILADAPLSEKVASTLVITVVGVLISGTIVGLRVLLLQLAAAREETDRLLELAQMERCSAEAERDRAALLSHELSHRVKNLFAVISSIVSLTGRSDPEARETVEKIRGRIGALANAHTIGMGKDGDKAVSLRRIVETTLAPYDGDGERITVAGPEAILPTEAITPMGLIVHELATNAVKYGALSEVGGTISATWNVSDSDAVTFSWVEKGGPLITVPPKQKGFGSTMLRQAETQLKATAERNWSTDGLELLLRFPLHR